MKITVIVRTYNRQDFLKEALTSIQLQTHTDWEVLIFDDGASIVNFQIYKKFKENNPTKRIQYITTDTPYDLFRDSWIQAPKIAHGELMVRLDDDDILAPDTLEFISDIYIKHPTLDFSYGSSAFFYGNEITELVPTQTPLEPPKTKDTWEGYLHGHPYNTPWRFKLNHYEEPQHYSSIIHCSKANIMCVYHTYAMRTESVRKVVDKITITSKFVDDLEFLGSLEYLGLTHTSIKRILTYVRLHHLGRVTDSNTLWEDIIVIRDKVEHLRTDNFKSAIFTEEIDGNFNEGYISSKHQSFFKEYKKKIEALTTKPVDDTKIDWRKFV
jgi:glycosyltransferase involved in cell wall biosynthesis